MAPSKQICCMHPQQRIDSPEPPSRPLASIDGIFAAAALPEDHPHAVQFKGLKEKKPEFDPTIIRSPGLADKIKLQLRKKSVKGLSKEAEYDDDAKAITSQEALAELQATSGSECSGSGQRSVRVEPVVLGVDFESRKVLENGSKVDVRSSLLGSAEYLRPLIEMPSIIAPSGHTPNIVDLADRVATRRVEQDIGREDERPLPPLPKSISTPLLSPGIPLYPPAVARRTKSELGLGEVLKLPKQMDPIRDIANAVCGTKEAAGTTVPSLHMPEATVNDDGGVAQIAITGPKALGEEPHLQHMDIPHQLRSMSQLSDPAEDDVSLMSGNPWNFHHRERSGVCFESSACSRHSRVKSSTGVNSTAVPVAWGRVRPPTAASSIYSRPTSAGANIGEEVGVESEKPPYTVPVDLNTLFSDWPLRPSGSSLGSASKAAGHNKPLPPPPFGSRKDSVPESFVTAKDKDDADTAQWLCPPGGEAGIPRTSSSSIISGSSKKSRFLERFSPPRRLVRKRRSIFKFLRPASRKQQARSISSPILSTKVADAAYDGPSDGPALLTVQYELVEQPQHTTRSASTDQLNAMRQSVSTNELLPPPQHLQRSPTLADYERKLSVMGDDRRRPSSMNLTRLNEIQEEDRRESIGIRRKLSRAKELKDDASPLMAQALTKHQQEKDMFRSSSKRREAEKAARPTPVFSAPTFETTGSSLAPTTEMEGESEVLDPLAKAEGSNVAGRENSATYLSPRAAAAGPSRRASSVARAAAPSTTVSFLQLKVREASVPSATDSRPKIGTSLASWSRYPSHTRFERSGSAGRDDNVITRDFAMDVDPDSLRASEESEPGSIGPHAGKNKSPRKQKERLQKSRSLTFGSIVRYYNNLFHTSGWAGQNRRTSVTLGGKLERPELEMLPPHVSDERKHGHETLKHLEDIVKEDAERVREFVVDEEDKIKRFVKGEEQRIGKFVEEEEDKIEGFVKKEEGKFMKFVHDEEDKWMQGYHHHQQQQEQNSSKPSSGMPFRHGSISRGGAHHPINDGPLAMTIDPNDAEQFEPVKDVQDPAADAIRPNALHLDGTATAPSSTKADLPLSEPSNAELWSNIYQDCIARPPSSQHQPARSESMPPLLEPMMMKPRIKRFPSVTVVDDRKGHWRSVSLISVKTSRP